jgi:hypothetical protein
MSGAGPGCAVSWITSAQFAAAIAAAEAADAAYTCLLLNAAGQAFTAAGGDEVATWPTEVSDVSGMHAGGTPTVATITAAGLWLIEAEVTLAGATGMNFDVRLLKNGGLIGRESSRGGGTLSTSTTQRAHALEICALNDIITVTVNTEADVSSTADPPMRFQLRRLCPVPA